jgi:uncharacterized protein YlxP (DUF503 family)
MVVLVERFELHIPQARSLKQKRHAIAPLTAMLRQTFHVSVAEVDHHDLWQRSTIAVAVVGADAHHLARVLQQIERRVDAWSEIEVLDRARDEWRPGD